MAKIPTNTQPIGLARSPVGPNISFAGPDATARAGANIAGGLRSLVDSGESIAATNRQGEQKLKERQDYNDHLWSEGKFTEAQRQWIQWTNDVQKNGSEDVVEQFNTEFNKYKEQALAAAPSKGARDRLGLKLDDLGTQVFHSSLQIEAANRQKNTVNTFGQMMVDSADSIAQVPELYASQQQRLQATLDLSLKQKRISPEVGVKMQQQINDLAADAAEAMIPKNVDAAREIITSARGIDWTRRHAILNEIARASETNSTLANYQQRETAKANFESIINTGKSLDSFNVDQYAATFPKNQQAAAKEEALSQIQIARTTYVGRSVMEGATAPQIFAALGRFNPATEVPKSFDTKLTPEQEAQFQVWKGQNAPNDSGADYDLRGAFMAGVKPGADGHMPDTFKKPNHPTFSMESQYSTPKNPGGTWEGDKFIPAKQLSFADQQQVYEHLTRFADQQLKAMREDPFTYARQDPIVNGAWKLVEDLPQDAKPDLRAMLTMQAMDSSVNFQRKLGIPDGKLSVMSNGQAQGLAAKINQGNVQDVQQTFSTMQQNFGKYYANAFRDLARLPEGQRIDGAMQIVALHMGQPFLADFIQAIRTPSSDYKVEPDDAKTIAEKLKTDKHFMAFSAALTAANPGAVSYVDDFRKAIDKYGTSLYFRNKADSPTKAVEQATELILGNAYLFTEVAGSSIAIKRAQGKDSIAEHDVSKIQAILADVPSTVDISQLNLSSFAFPPNLSKETMDRSIKDTITKDTFWSTNPENDGAILYMNGAQGQVAPVKYKDGKNVEVKFLDAISQFNSRKVEPVSPYSRKADWL